MLQDPENLYEEWSEEIRANSLDEAKRKCQRIAETGGLTQVLNVTQKTKTLGKGGSYKFICWFKTEIGGQEHDSSNNPGD